MGIFGVRFWVICEEIHILMDNKNKKESLMNHQQLSMKNKLKQLRGFVVVALMGLVHAELALVLVIQLRLN